MGNEGHSAGVGKVYVPKRTSHFGPLRFPGRKEKMPRSPEVSYQKYLSGHWEDLLLLDARLVKGDYLREIPVSRTRQIPKFDIFGACVLVK